VNTVTDTSFSSVEKRESGLKKMLSTVLKDKEKIEDTIEELDRYKRDALMKTWKKVDGYVFSTTSEGMTNSFFSVISEGSSPSFCQETLRNCSLLKTKISWMVSK
jgi:hypothetical protein